MATCSYTVPDKNTTGDNFYGTVICNQAYIDYFWNTYGFSGNKDYWDDGFGWEDPCNTDKPLARTFNACYLLTYSAQDYQNDAYSGPMLNWARRYVRDNSDDLRSLCGDGSAIARSFSGAFVDDRIELYLGFWYSKEVPGRAETLIHESRHQATQREVPRRFGVRRWQGRSRLGLELPGRMDVRRTVPVWFYAQGARTTSALRERARQRGNLVIDNAFATHPGFNI